MKKTKIIFLLLISYQMVFAQTQRPKCYYDDISTESVLNYLTEEEEKSFFIFSFGNFSSTISKSSVIPQN